MAPPTPNNTKVRGARMSKNQQEVYIKFLEDNLPFSSGTNSISYDLNSREKDFERLVEILNSTVGAVKSRRRWQEVSFIHHSLQFHLISIKISTIFRL